MTQASPETVKVEVETRFRQQLNGVEVKGIDGLIITPSSDIDRAQLDAFLEPFGWFVSSHLVGGIIIEPVYTSECRVEADHLFHVAPADRRTSIMTTGLLPQVGGTTAVKRTYRPRIYFALTLDAAHGYARFRRDHHGGQPPPELELYRVAIPSSHRFYRDVCFLGRGVWSDMPIGPSNLKLVADWPALERRLRAELDGE